jgi:prevent-host-death family protein
MRVSLTDAKAQLAELVRRAEAGEEVELTRHGQTVATIKGVKREPTGEEWDRIRQERRRILEEISASASRNALPGPDAAHSADFLYGDDGMPE